MQIAELTQMSVANSMTLLRPQEEVRDTASIHVPTDDLSVPMVKMDGNSGAKQSIGTQ